MGSPLQSCGAHWRILGLVLIPILILLGIGVMPLLPWALLLTIFIGICIVSLILSASSPAVIAELLMPMLFCKLWLRIWSAIGASIKMSQIWPHPRSRSLTVDVRSRRSARAWNRLIPDSRSKTGVPVIAERTDMRRTIPLSADGSCERSVSIQGSLPRISWDSRPSSRSEISQSTSIV